MSIAKRVTYLKGMAEGLNLGKDTKEEKILQVIIEILEDISVELEDLTEDVLSLDDDMSAIIEDVQDIEDVLFEDEKEPCACGCDRCGCGNESAQSDIPAPQPPAYTSGPALNFTNGKHQKKPQLYAVQCPSCQNEMQIDDEVLRRGTLTCPNCGERLELEEPS
ncbi:MAG: hypothetical protein FWE12_00185 [Oscillospiraceae bacterium]|nr:hypothetical protein [Oscillospiraceae bacterium]